MKLDVQTHFSQGWNIDLINKAKELGVEEIRDSQPWGRIETTSGQYIFPTQLVNYMDAAEQAGIASLLTFASANTLYDGGLTPYTQAGREAYANHIVAVLTKYGGQVQEIEIWNEFNGATAFKGPAAKDAAGYYAELLKVVYETVKPLFPEVKVLGGSVNVIGTGILEDIFELGALQHMDGIAVHPYRNTPEHVDDELNHLKDVMVKFGGVKPIYATEFGKEFTDAAQAPDYMLKMATLMASAGVEESYWYALIDQSHFKNMGLLTTAGEEKPAADAFEFLKKTLLPLGDPVRIETGDDLTLVYKFGTDTYVMWGTDRKIDFAGGGSFFDARGAAIAAPTSLSMSPIVFKGAGYELAASAVIADSLMQFGEGDWQYFAKYSSGTLVPLELKDWEWTSYYGSQYTKPLRVNADSIAPAGTGSKPIQVVERFVSDRDQTIGIDASWRTGAGDGVDLHILVNGVEIFSKIFGGLFELDDMRLSLKAGDTLDFAMGPNQYVQGDSTARHITLTRIASPAPQPAALGLDLLADGSGSTLAGSQHGDRLQGLAGNDRLFGGGGDDVLLGGAGRNELDGGEGFDTVSYEGATSAVDVRFSSWLTQGSSEGTQDRFVSIEAVVGSRFADRFSGSERDEAFAAGAGDDVIYSSLGQDTIDGGDGHDTLTFDNSKTAVSVNLSDMGVQTVAAGSTMRLVSIERLVGSHGDDRLQAGNFGDTIDGGRGDDLVLGGAGDDELSGGAGVNTVSYAAAASGVTVALGVQGAQDTVGAGLDTLARFQNLSGSAFADRLSGSSSANALDGGAGDDVLVGGAGGDTLRGGAGADRFTYLAVSDSRSSAMDTILDFSRAEGDLIDLRAVDASSRTAGDQAFALVAAFTRTAGELTVTAEAGGFRVLGDVNGDGTADFGFAVMSAEPLTASAFML